MFKTYAGRVPVEVDLVCNWFEKAGRQIASGKASRAGLVATNSIRGGANRRALEAATETRRIFEAWSDEPWVIDGRGGTGTARLLLESRRRSRVRRSARR